MTGMAASRLGFSLLVLLNLVLYMASTAESTVAKRSNPVNSADFIKSSCKATRYPVVCVESLLGYANLIRQSDQQLAITALNVSRSGTRSCASFVKQMAKVRGIKPRDYRAVQDCIENMDDSVDRLSQSMRELGLTGKAMKEEFAWHMSNVQTWVSAALTDQNTCLDGFAAPRMDGNLKAAIKSRVVSVSQVTSNALALVNRFASTHQTATLN